VKPRARRALTFVGASAASAALLAAAVHLPSPAHLLVLVALVPWLLAADGVRGPGEALAAGAALAAALSLAVLGWFAPAVAGFTGLPKMATWAALAAGAPLLQPQLPLAALARWLAARGGGGRLRAGAAFSLAWVAVEWAVPKLLGDTLGHGLQPAAALRQAADLGGAALVTLLVLATSELLAAGLAALSRGEPRRAAPAAGALALLLACWAGYGEARLAELRAAPARPTITAGVVQSAIVNYDALARERSTYDVVREVLDVHEAASRELVRAGADLLLWPETVYPTTFGAPRSEDGAAFDRELEAFVQAERVPLVFGAYEAEGGREYNAAFFLSPGATAPGRASYRKAHLFPLTERVPAALDGPRVRRLLPWLGTWTPGPGPRVLDLVVRGRALRIAPMLCYDAVHPEHAAAGARGGADLLVALSNDAWFDGGPGPALHLAVTAFRAVETRLPIVRAAPSGISAAIDASGEIFAATRPEERTALAVELEPGAALAPPFLVVGRFLGPACLAALVILVAWPRRRGVVARAGGERARKRAA